MNILIIVFTQLLLLFAGPAADRLAQVAGRVFAADHEPDLAGRVGRDRGVGVLDLGEDLAAVGFEFGDEREVQPLVFSWEGSKLVWQR